MFCKILQNLKLSKNLLPQIFKTPCTKVSTHSAEILKTGKLARILSDTLEQKSILINSPRIKLFENFSQVQKTFSDEISKWERQSAVSIAKVSELYSSIIENQENKRKSGLVDENEINERLVDTKVRIQQLIAIHEAEHNHQIARNNARFCEVCSYCCLPHLGCNILTTTKNVLYV